MARLFDFLTVSIIGDMSLLELIVIVGGLIGIFGALFLARQHSLDGSAARELCEAKEITQGERDTILDSTRGHIVMQVLLAFMLGGYVFIGIVVANRPMSPTVEGRTAGMLVSLTLLSGEIAVIAAIIYSLRTRFKLDRRPSMLIVSDKEN